jgi:hypothetical protein
MSHQFSKKERAFIEHVFVDVESVLEKSSEKIRAFIREYPRLLDEPSRDIRNPLLHRLCMDLARNADRRAIRIRQIQQLIDIDPSCLLKQDDFQNVPVVRLHNRDECNEDPAVMELLNRMVRAMPSALTVQNRYGETVLHMACNSSMFVPFFFEANPKAAMIRDIIGQTPLHIACESRPAHVVEYLLQQNRDVLRCQDDRGFLPLHQVCDRYPLAEMIVLMRRHMPLLPELMTVKDKEGRKPGDYWDEVHENSMEQITTLLEEEYSTQECMNWMNEVTETLQPYQVNLVASIVLHWTKTHNKKGLEKLTSIEAELNNLVDILYSENAGE